MTCRTCPALRGEESAFPRSAGARLVWIRPTGKNGCRLWQVHRPLAKPRSAQRPLPLGGTYPTGRSPGAEQTTSAGLGSAESGAGSGLPAAGSSLHFLALRGAPIRTGSRLGAKRGYLPVAATGPSGKQSIFGYMNGQQEATDNSQGCRNKDANRGVFVRRSHAQNCRAGHAQKNAANSSEVPEQPSTCAGQKVLTRLLDISYRRCVCLPPLGDRTVKMPPAAAGIHLFLYRRV